VTIAACIVLGAEKASVPSESNSSSGDNDNNDNNDTLLILIAEEAMLTATINPTNKATSF
jgi:hypothetical protein